MWLILNFLLVISQECFGIEFVSPDKLNQFLQVKTSNGLIQGKQEKSYNGVQYFSYVGIPYAQPPINELRFRDPMPINNWSTVLNATVKGPCCAGLDVVKVSANLELKGIGEEDCLYLNVYTPIAPKEEILKKPLSVMVYFFGGGFSGGCSNDYGPDFFMEDDVVLVIPNFRLSVFGFLSTEDMESPGNWASKDQVTVLKWIHLNIDKFGGDPQTVTIFGQSSGGANVNTLLLTEKAKGLFHRAIMLSGCSLSFWAYQMQPKQVAFDIGISVGIETNDTKILIEKLRKVDSKKLIESQIAVIFLNMLSLIHNGLPFAPSLESEHQEAILTNYPYQIMEKGEFNKVPVMMGVTSLEMVSFKKQIGLLKPVMVLFNLSPGSMIRITKDLKNKRIVANKLKKFFFNTTDMLNVKEEDLLKFFSVEAYNRPMRKAAHLLSKHNPVYFYQFSYEGQLGVELLKKHAGQPNFVRDINGVGHTEDIGYLFKSKLIGMKYYNKEMGIIKKMARIYTNFAKTGNPTPIQDPLLDNVTWPKVTPEQCPYMILKERFESVLSENYDENNFQFWQEIFRKYADKPYIVY